MLFFEIFRDHFLISHLLIRALMKGLNPNLAIFSSIFYELVDYVIPILGTFYIEDFKFELNMIFFKCYENTEILSALVTLIWGIVNKIFTVFEVCRVYLGYFLYFFTKSYCISKMLLTSCCWHQKFDHNCSSYPGNEAQRFLPFFEFF